MSNHPLNHWKRDFAAALTLGAMAASVAFASDEWRITIPRRSELTRVQRLNREGVALAKKQQYEKAEALFYKAYLYDPADPFTLNNLGYVSELEGQLDRARKFYDLAAEQGSDANIDMSNIKHLEGKPMKTALVNLQDSAMRVNRMNINAIRLLEDNRGFEAVALLRETLRLDPNNPFTLNNLGVANEAIGDYDSALRCYEQAAARQSKEPIVVTVEHEYRGRPVSRTAEESAHRLRRRMEQGETAELRANMLTMRGVYALNQNDWTSARQDFERAYSLNPQSAFSLNNLGYVAEKDGDLESAQYFYQKARRASDAGGRVGLATELSAEGKQLSLVAEDSNQKVGTALDAYSRARRRETGPVELTPRDSSSPGAQPVTPH